METLHELRSLVTTLEQATLILRQRFVKNPPEQTRTYRLCKKNPHVSEWFLCKVARINKNLRNAPIRDKTQTISPGVYVATESRLGLPAGTRFFSRLTSDSLFELSLAKTDKGMKIVWAQVYPFN